MDYEIITRVRNGCKLTFLTRAKNLKGALRNLINRSHDFEYISEHYTKQIIDIKIKVI